MIEPRDNSPAPAAGAGPSGLRDGFLQPATGVEPYDLAEAGVRSGDPSARADGAFPASSAGQAPAAASGRWKQESAKTPRKQRSGGPPETRRGAWGAWLILLAVLLIAALPLSLDLRHTPEIRPLESASVAASTRAWEQQHAAAPAMRPDWSIERLLPRTAEGEVILREPPGLTWMHLTALVGLTPVDADAGEVLLRLRSVSVLATLLVIAAVFWCAYSIGGLKPALFASLVCLANPVLMFYGRLASPALPQLAWVMLAIAAALWAIRPLKPRPSLGRQIFGWGLGGLLLAGALLASGSVALGPVVGALVVIILLCPHRTNHAVGLLAMLLIAGLVTTPWTLYVHAQDPMAYQAWADALVPGYWQQPIQLLPLLGWRSALMVLAMFPWLLWLVAGYVQPFSASSSGVRSRMFIGWAWVQTVCVLMLLAPGPVSLPALLVVVPAASILVGQVIRQYSDLSAEGRHARFWCALRWPMVVALLLLSVLLPVGMFLHPRLLDWGVLGAGYDLPLIAPMHPFYWSGMAGALLMTTLLSWRFAQQQHPGSAAVCWAGWLILLMVLCIYPLTRGPLAETLMEARRPFPWPEEPVRHEPLESRAQDRPSDPWSGVIEIRPVVVPSF